jgi:hypothetical protein
MALALAYPAVGMAKSIEEQTWNRGKERKTGTEISLMSLIGQFAEPKLAMNYLGQTYQNGAKLLDLGHQRQYDNLMAPFSFPFNQSLNWVARAGGDPAMTAMMLLNKSTLNFEVMKLAEMRANQLSADRFRSGEYQGGYGIQELGMVVFTYYAIACATAAMRFSNTICSRIANDLKNQTYTDLDQAKNAVAAAFKRIKRSELREIFAENCDAVLFESFNPLPPKKADSPMLTSWQSSKTGEFFTFDDEEGWTYASGRPLLCPKLGLVNGAKVTVSISNSTGVSSKEQRY